MIIHCTTGNTSQVVCECCKHELLYDRVRHCLIQFYQHMNESAVPITSLRHDIDRTHATCTCKRHDKAMLSGVTTGVSENRSSPGHARYTSGLCISACGLLCPPFGCSHICHASARRRGLGQQGVQSIDMPHDIMTQRIW